MSKASSSSGDSVKSKSSVKTRKSVEYLHNIDMIGTTNHQIVGAKLPSNRQLLQVMFYNMRFVNLSANLSAKLAIEAANIFWEQARIPTRQPVKCQEKLMKLYELYQNIRKTTEEKRSAAKKKEAEKFLDELDDLFDIAAANALEVIKIPEDREFLVKQRQKGRPGCMAGADMSLYAREKRSKERKEKEEERKRKHDEEMSQQSGI